MADTAASEDKPVKETPKFAVAITSKNQPILYCEFFAKTADDANQPWKNPCGQELYQETVHSKIKFPIVNPKSIKQRWIFHCITVLICRITFELESEFLIHQRNQTVLGGRNGGWSVLSVGVDPLQVVGDPRVDPWETRLSTPVSE
ncbi:hypothetical protein AVEN_30135-1 [Araneus ventricosus]|uniref:Uncharacterized protein n=1 Tax=Araneus ventricosus TaxID=182803 RepID=A0A4Y2M901_ARAVE|nr:hypothetical protein AVEN_30135-1 [Araneus ventricosus]